VRDTHTHIHTRTLPFKTVSVVKGSKYFSWNAFAQYRFRKVIGHTHIHTQATHTHIYTLCFSKWLPWSWGQKETEMRWRNSSCHSTHVHNNRDRDRDRDRDTHLHTLPFRVASVVMGSIKIWNALAQFLMSFDTPLRCPSILADCRCTTRLIVAASARLHTHTNTHICIHIYIYTRETYLRHVRVRVCVRVCVCLCM